MRRIVLWILSTTTVVVLLFGYHTSTSGATASSDVVARSAPTPGAAATAQAGAGASASASASASPSAGSGSTSTSTSASTSKKSSRTASKTVTGPTVQTQWGPVQVKVTVESGRLTDVTVVQYPSGNPKDQEINDYALPVLVKEAIDAQSAKVDMVSGATVTSVGYLSSLQSALDEAGL